MISTFLFQMLTFAFCKRKLSRQVTNFKIKSYHKNTSNYQSQQNNLSSNNDNYRKQNNLLNRRVSRGMTR